MFYYYLFNNKVLFSREKYLNFNEISENQARQYDGMIYFLYRSNPLYARRSYCVSDPSLFFLEKEGICLLQKPLDVPHPIPDWIIEKINKRKIKSVNTEYPTWTDVLDYSLPQKWKIHVIGTGDVGGMLVTGLKLVGGDDIAKIGIYSKDVNSAKRWEYEVNQILSPLNSLSFTTPEVFILNKNELFECDILVFCASVGVPPIGHEEKDVRIAQFEGNAEIIRFYANLARSYNFKGIFAVVSDPVDLLCKVAFISSNTNSTGILDFNGLAGEQIRGFGLGVMHARAVYYAKQDIRMQHYKKEGRAFGPHGKDLIIADSIERYNDSLSKELTEKTQKANLDIRATGFKPYVAPALSSGSLSILAMIRQSWHYSATFMGGVYMGARNRLLEAGTEVERLPLPNQLVCRIENTYQMLRSTV